MKQPLPKATPDLAKTVWASQRSPSARSVARALTQSGRPVHFTTVNRWRCWEWRDAKGQHPLDQARAALESALPLMTGDATSTIEGLVHRSPERQNLEGLSDGELLRKAARELAMAVYVVARKMLRQEAEALVITRTGAVAVLVRALADAIIVTVKVHAARLEEGSAPNYGTDWKSENLVLLRRFARVAIRIQHRNSGRDRSRGSVVY